MEAIRYPKLLLDYRPIRRIIRTEQPLKTGAGNFSLHYRVQTGSGAHPVSYAMNPGGYFLGNNAATGA
jgi:hypothetical protein